MGQGATAKICNIGSSTQTSGRTSLQCRCQSPERGPETKWSLLVQRYPRPFWMSTTVTCCRELPWRWVGLDGIQKSLPASKRSRITELSPALRPEHKGSLITLLTHLLETFMKSFPWQRKKKRNNKHNPQNLKQKHKQKTTN